MFKVLGLVVFRFRLWGVGLLEVVGLMFKVWGFGV